MIVKLPIIQLFYEHGFEITKQEHFWKLRDEYNKKTMTNTVNCGDLQILIIFALSGTPGIWGSQAQP